MPFRVILLCFLLFLWVHYSAQSFVKVIGSTQDDEVTHDVLRSGSNFYIVGESNVNDNNGDASITKVNENATIIWSQTYGTSINDEDIRGIAELSNGNIMITGSRESYNEIINFEIDAFGDLTGEIRRLGVSQDRLHKITNSTDNGYLVYGMLEGAINSVNEITIYNYTNDHEVIWKRHYAPNNESYQGESAFRDLIQRKDSSFVGLFQYAEFGNVNNHQPRLICIDKEGDVLWVKGYSCGASEYYFDMDTLSNGDIVSVGYTKGYGGAGFDVVVVRMSSLGEVIWLRTFGGNGDDIAKKLIINGSEIAIVGYTNSFGFGNNDGFLLRTDLNGNLIAFKCYGGEMNDDYTSIHLYNDHYFLFGTTTSFTSSSDHFITKSDVFGNVSGDCVMDVTDLIVLGEGQPLESNYTYSATEAPDMFAHSFTKESWLPLDSAVCSTCIINLNLGDDTVLCQGSNLNLYGLSGNYEHLWSTGATVNSIVVNSTGKYWLKVDSAQCEDSDTIMISFKPAPQVVLPEDTFICDRSTFNVDVSYPNAMYLWSDGVTDSIREINTEGAYSVSVILDGCEKVKRFYVGYYDSTRVLYPDTTICDDEAFQVTLPSNNEGSSFVWLDGTLGPDHIIADEGEYTYSVKHACENYTHSFNISYKNCRCNMYVPSAFTPNGDNRNNMFSFNTDCVPTVFEMRIYDRWGKELFYTNDYMDSWDGTYHGKLVPEGVYSCAYKHGFEDQVVKSGVAAITLIR